MITPQHPWSSGSGASGTAPGDPRSQDAPGASAAADGAPAEPRFPQTGWSATVMGPEGRTWQGGTEDRPGPAYEWEHPGRLSYPAPGAQPNPTVMPQTAGPVVGALAPSPGPRLGIAAFSLVTAMTFACVILAFWVGKGMGMAMVAFSTPVFDPMEITHAGPMQSDQLSAIVGIGFLASLIGITGLVMAIAARRRGSAPALSLTAVILGLCSPMLAFIALLAATTPYIQQISG